MYHHFTFSATWGCVSLPRSTNSSDWKWLGYMSLGHNLLSVSQIQDIILLTNRLHRSQHKRGNISIVDISYNSCSNLHKVAFFQFSGLLFLTFVRNVSRILVSASPNILEHFVEFCCVFSKLDYLASNTTFVSRCWWNETCHFEILLHVIMIVGLWSETSFKLCDRSLWAFSVSGDD